MTVKGGGYQKSTTFELDSGRGVKREKSQNQKLNEE